MPKLDVTVPHSLGRDEALRRMKEKTDFLQKTYGAEAAESEQEWNDNVMRFKFQAMGFKISGNLTVEDAQVVIHAELPMAAFPFKGVAERRIRQELETMLA